MTAIEQAPDGRTVRARDTLGMELVFSWNEITTVAKVDGTRLGAHDLHVGHVIDVVWVERNTKRIPLEVTIVE